MGPMAGSESKKSGFLDMSGYQWLVLFAAWLGWGFDVFDGLLFNYVAPNAVPTLMGLTIGSDAGKAATLQWTGILTSVLLVGWAIGGILFGRVADKIGRTKTLLITMLLYAFGTAACAFAPNIWVLLLCRIVASLGIGGEWAAGASMVAEVVPEKRRIEAGALLYTSAPLGLFLATFVNQKIAGEIFKGDPTNSWRYVFLCGLIPAAVAFIIRSFVKEPERWKSAADSVPKLSELFSPEMKRITISGLLMSLVALIMWWSCNAFIGVVSAGLADSAFGGKAAAEIKEGWKSIATNSFNLGGLIGTLLTIPIAKHIGRKPMFLIYFIASAAALMATFGLPMPAEMRLYMYFFIGLSIFGVFGSFTFYLPELFPTRLRGTGAGFCYNAGRIIAAGGPFLVGYISSTATDKLGAAMSVLFWLAVVPLLGLLLLPMAIETKGRLLED